MRGLEGHHPVPICLKGRDRKKTLIYLQHNSHTQLHQTLDIPGNIYHRLVRKARARTNHKLLRSPDDIEIRADMQRRYLLNLEHLPERLIKKHVISFKKILKTDIRNFKELTGESYDGVTPHLDYPTHVRNLHEQSILCQKDIARALNDAKVNYYYNKNGK